MKNPKFKYYPYYQTNPNFKIPKILFWIWDLGFIGDLVVLGFGIYYSVVGIFLSTLASYYFNQHSLRTATVKFSIENLFPRAEI